MRQRLCVALEAAAPFANLDAISTALDDACQGTALAGPEPGPLRELAAWLVELRGYGLSTAGLAEAAELSLRNIAGGGPVRLESWRRSAVLRWLTDRRCPERTAHRLLNRYPERLEMPGAMKRYGEWLKWLMDQGLSEAAAEAAANKHLEEQPGMARAEFLVGTTKRRRRAVKDLMGQGLTEAAARRRLERQQQRRAAATKAP